MYHAIRTVKINIVQPAEIKAHGALAQRLNIGVAVQRRRILNAGEFPFEVPIQIRGQPIYSDAQDTYFNYDESGQNHPPPPQLFICRDTYFTVDTSNGLVYHPTGSPPGSQA